MHIIVSHAKPDGPQCTQALSTLQLPNLHTLLRRFHSVQRIHYGPDSLTPPAERLYAQCLALPVQDGLVPLAAWRAAQWGLPGAIGEGWAQLSLCHWQIQADHVAMQDPAGLGVTQAESDALREAMHEFFAQDGIALHPGGAGTWLARGALFADLPTASLDRACGNRVDAWMPRQAQARPLRRLQNEMQMLLYTHPVNDARALARLPPINSFWVSATGLLPSGLPTVNAEVQYVSDLRQAALADDPVAWAASWRQIDSTVLASSPTRVTLASSAYAQTFAHQTPTAWTRLKSRFTQPDVHALLQSL